MNIEKADFPDLEMPDNEIKVKKHESVTKVCESTEVDDTGGKRITTLVYTTLHEKMREYGYHHRMALDKIVIASLEVFFKDKKK